MRKLTALVLALAYMLVGCCQPKQVPPEADLDAPFRECWPGTIIDIFIEDSGVDQAEIIELEIKDHEPMYFTLMEDTEYLVYYSDTGESEEIAEKDLYIGAWVEIDCESYHNSGYHPVFSVMLIESIKKQHQTLEVMENTVAGVRRGTFQTSVELSEEDAAILSGIINQNSWSEGISECESDCAINVKGNLVYYHSDCGTLNRYNLLEMSTYSSKVQEVNGKSLKMTEEERLLCNSVIQKYITLSSDKLIYGEQQKHSENDVIYDEGEPLDIGGISREKTEEISMESCKDP